MLRLLPSCYVALVCPVFESLPAFLPVSPPPPPPPVPLLFYYEWHALGYLLLSAVTRFASYDESVKRLSQEKGRAGLVELDRWWREVRGRWSGVGNQ